MFQGYKKFKHDKEVSQEAKIQYRKHHLLSQGLVYDKHVMYIPHDLLYPNPTNTPDFLVLKISPEDLVHLVRKALFQSWCHSTEYQLYPFVQVCSHPQKPISTQSSKGNHENTKHKTKVTKKTKDHHEFLNKGLSRVLDWSVCLLTLKHLVSLHSWASYTLTSDWASLGSTW